MRPAAAAAAAAAWLSYACFAWVLTLVSFHFCASLRRTLAHTARAGRSPAAAAALLKSPSAGASRDGGAPPTVAGGATCNVACAPHTTQLDRLVEKALTAGQCGRYALAAGFFRRAVDEALPLHGDTFVCTLLTLRRAMALCCQLQLEGVTPEEQEALGAEAWALASSCLPLIVRRMDANTMLPGRGTAVELAFFKRFTATKQATFDWPYNSPLSTRELQLVGLSLGYATAVLAADALLGFLCLRLDVEAQGSARGRLHAASHTKSARHLAGRRGLLCVHCSTHTFWCFCCVKHRVCRITS